MWATWKQRCFHFHEWIISQNDIDHFCAFRSIDIFRNPSSENLLLKKLFRLALGDVLMLG
jgi:hypothetical protein